MRSLERTSSIAQFTERRCHPQLPHQQCVVRWRRREKAEGDSKELLELKTRARRLIAEAYGSMTGLAGRHLQRGGPCRRCQQSHHQQSASITDGTDGRQVTKEWMESFLELTIGSAGPWKPQRKGKVWKAGSQWKESLHDYDFQRAARMLHGRICAIPRAETRRGLGQRLLQSMGSMCAAPDPP